MVKNKMILLMFYHYRISDQNSNDIFLVPKYGCFPMRTSGYFSIPFLSHRRSNVQVGLSLLVPIMV